MSSAPAANRPFNALNGLEIKKAILADITNHMNADTRFSQHLSYPLVSWKFALDVDAFPPEIGSFTTKTQGKLSSDNPRPIDDEEEEAEHIHIEGGRSVMAPVEGQTADAVRRDTRQQVPSPKVVQGPAGSRSMVETSPVTDEKPNDEKEEASETDVQTERGVVARRVTAKTRAAKKGVSVREPQGSAPDAEDVEKIAARVAKENQE